MARIKLELELDLLLVASLVTSFHSHSHSHASISNHVVLNFLTLIDVSRLIFSPRPLLALPYNLQLENTLAHLTYTSIFLSLANTHTTHTHLLVQIRPQLYLTLALQLFSVLLAKRS